MIKILAFCPIKADATSFYRGFGPLNHLKKFYDLQIDDGSALPMPVTWEILLQYDLLFFQRPTMHTETMVMDMAKRCNRPIWIDYDDDYLNIPVTNPRYHLYADPHRVTHIYRAIEHADFITTSTISLKESIAKITGKERHLIQVIPNAVDETVFDISQISDVSQHNVVLWRGGDTHDQDMAPYLDKMVELYNEFPDFKWAFMGHAPEKILSRIDASRILLYPFDEVMKYFDWLFELRPAVTLVPWEENTFNHGKSGCSWLESTLAGSVTVFPGWSTEFVDGMASYNDPDSFYKKAFTLLSDQLKREEFYRKSQEVLSSRFTLGAMKETRISIIHSSMSQRITMGKLGINHPKYSMAPMAYTDKQFFDYTWEHQLNQNFAQYNDGHRSVAQWLLDEFKPKSVIELGCGPGPMVEFFCDMKVPQVVGMDLNEHFKEYFTKRNPHYDRNFILGSFLDLEIDGIFDLCISIEVFEHIPQEHLQPFIEKMADHFRVLYFSSTPYRSNQKFDHEWGHCNVKTWEMWRKLFEDNGFQFVDNPKKITIWDMLLVSTRINKATEVALEEEHLLQ